MQTENSEWFPVHSSEDIVKVRRVVRVQAQVIGLGTVDQTKLVTAASEIARNMVDYGGGGKLTIETVSSGDGRRGVRLVFEDRGPGIADIEQAMQDGFSTAGGLGLGLGGAMRLTSDFSIESRMGEGTRVMLVRWA